MTHIIQLDENDLVNMVMEMYDAKPSEVTARYTEETHGYGMDEHTRPVFSIEVKIKGEK